MNVDAPKQGPSSAVRMLFAYIEARGISNRWLARSLGLSDSMLTHIKAGRRRASREFIEKAAAALGVPAAIFFGLDEHKRTDLGQERTEEREPAEVVG